MLVPQGMPCGTHGCHANHSPTKTELLPKATAQPERTLEAVGCKAWVGDIIGANYSLRHSHTLGICTVKPAFS